MVAIYDKCDNFIMNCPQSDSIQTTSSKSAKHKFKLVTTMVSIINTCIKRKQEHKTSQHLFLTKSHLKKQPKLSTDIH